MNKKLGYYTVGSKEIESKIHACIFATHLLKNMPNEINPFSLIKWHFNQEVFNNYNWSVEPELSLDELYNKRARELREKYDYIVVSYSGGADSHNILMSFYRQNLHIDEIVVNCLEKGMENYAVVDPNVKDAKYAHYSELKLQTIPRLKEIKNIFPNTKINMFDMTDHLFQAFSNTKESWVLKMREEMNPIDVTRYNYIHFLDFRKKLDKDKKVALIMGIDKPRILIDKHNNVYTRFFDRVANNAPIGEYMKDYTNTIVEYFYWSPDSIDMLCKQAHVVKKWLELNPDYQTLFSKSGPRANLFPSGNFSFSNDRVLRSILYSTWNNKWFQSNKGVFDWHTEFDSWFIHGCSNTKEYAVWKEGLEHVVKHAKPFLGPKIENKYDGFVTFHYDYFIGKLKNVNSFSIL